MVAMPGCPACRDRLQATSNVAASDLQVDCKHCGNKDRAIASLREQLALHEKSTALLEEVAINDIDPLDNEKEMEGLTADKGSKHADVIRHLVECGRMEMVKDDSTWGCCAVWVEEGV